MQKRTVIVLFFATLFAVGGLGIVTNAMATGDYSDNLPGDYSCRNFNIELIGVSRDHGDVFQYRYTVTGKKFPTCKLYRLEFGIEEALVVTETDEVEVFPPGEGGEGIVNWLGGVPQLQVLASTPQGYTADNPLIVYAAGTGGHVGKVAAHTLAGLLKHEVCFIDGPITSLVPVDASMPLAKTIVLNGSEGDVEYCIDIDPRTGCPSPTDPKVYNCETGQPLPLDQGFVLGSTGSGDEEGPTAPTFVGSNGDICPVIKASHNPCQWILLSGRAYGPVCW